MEHGAGQEVWLKDVIVFLVAAGLIVPLLRRWKMSAVLGFLLAGIALGPFGLGQFVPRLPVLEYITISEPETAAPFAELGVLFLLFLLGLELSFQKLWQLRRAVFGIGGLQAFVSAGLIAGAAWLAGLPPPAALTVGFALALSSTAIVMQVLAEERRTLQPVGRTSLAVLLFQDILVAPILILVGFLSRDSETGLLTAMLEALVQGTIAIAIIVLIGRFGLNRVFRYAAQGGRDFLMALLLLVVVGAAVLTAGAGLSLALGAFLAGLLLGETEFKHQAEVDLEPFKGLLLGLFFMTVGMGLDLQGVLRDLWVIAGGLFGLLLLKGVIAFFAVRLISGSRPVAIEAAFLLAPAGEFAFVIVAAAGGGALFDPEMTTILTAMAALSMLFTPISGRLGRMLAERMGQPDPGVPGVAGLTAPEDHVVIAGFGRVGEAIARVLKTEEAEIVALDRRPGVVSRARKAGWQVYLGDASRPEILMRAGAQGASLFVVTVDDALSAEAMVRAVREVRRDALVLARAQDAHHAHRLSEAGADFIIPDAIEAGLQLAGRALEEYGLAPETVRDRIAAARDAEYARARKQQD
ncbi:potassium transporter TrkA [Marinicauda pacifica]|uniref:Portal protein n=1 Tax=Marinicauda pacifica TaxID=1133559 RepID=A0A4S2HD24_9PROT|nr:cation:proton antiporter [Marinicauda pacifica]TGY93950.1 portal protein [Marinicauda pacifica]GGE31668.1 potassium transporter TrkA [Marinicauda pacifica]